MSNQAFYLKALQPHHEEELVLPADEFAEIILKHFKMTKEDFERAFYQAAGAFSKLWSFESNANLSYDFKSGKVMHEGMSYRILSEEADSKSKAWIRSVSGWISTSELNSVLTNFKKQQTGKLVPHKDLFGLIIGSELKGKDLISACLTSASVNEQCEANDQQIFKDRLQEEFDVDFDADSYNYPDARSLYIQMHTLYIEVHTVMSPEYDEIDPDDALMRPLRFTVVLNGVSHLLTTNLPDDGVVGGRLDLFVPKYNPDEFPCKEVFMEDLAYDDRHCDGYIVLPFTVKWSDEARTVPLEVVHLEHVKEFLMIYGEGEDLKRDDLMEEMLEKFTSLIEIEDRPHRGGDPLPFVTNRAYYEKNGLSEYYTWYFAIAK